MNTFHSKRTNSFLGHGSVQRKQSILRKNDKYINCRGDLELSKYTKRGGKKGGRSLWMLMNIGSQLQKWEKFTISALEVWIRKGVQKGGHHFRMLVPTICTMIRSSGGCFRGQICIFWSSHCVNSNIIGCPPFAPPFSSFHFLKNLQPQIFPESKIKFVRPLDRNIKGCEF